VHTLWHISGQYALYAKDYIICLSSIWNVQVKSSRQSLADI